MGIVVFGATFVDIKGYPITQYIEGGRNVGRVCTVHGGVSRNVAEDIANVELRPTFISVVDDNGTGQDVIDKLNRHMINTSYIRKVPGGLGTWLAVFNNQGDVVASISQRPDLSEIRNILKEKGDEIISQSDSIVVEIDMDSDILKKIFELADKYNKKVYAVVSNMSIAMERRDLLARTACVVCNQQEAGLLYSEDYSGYTPEQMQKVIEAKVKTTRIYNMVVTMGHQGAVYASLNGESGFCPPRSVVVMDTTGAGDSFFAGVAIGLTYGKTLGQSCEIGTRLAASVIATKENVCPRFLPEEFGLDVKITDLDI
ncbi:carbohydrate kinase family protein [Butyrivibrio sp. NC3005]|uniref:carbohydrate kinase family protein n=1 Tax=Butyrivibrio sp. NC3005 TaxID=1280685 RepID=UPI000429AA9D|nr:PfkB family carbohydrate kinase [Butyrivibrio sp. NC3005]